MTRLATDPVAATMRQLGLAVTRQSYIEFGWSPVPDQWGAEDEDALPDELQLGAHTPEQRAAIHAHARAILNEAFDPSEPRDEDGKWTDGGGGGSSSGDSGGGGTSASDYKPGLKASNDDRKIKATKESWIANSPIKSLADVLHAGPQAQSALGKVGSRIAERFKVMFSDPGPKTKNEKGIARTKEKIEKRGGNAARVTDVARATFIVNHPYEVESIVEELSKHFEVTLENWRQTDLGYLDRAALVRFDNGLIGEVLFMDPGMAKAKEPLGHSLYEKWRSLDLSKMADRVHADALVASMLALYGGVVANYPPEWKAVLGSALT